MNKVLLSIAAVALLMTGCYKDDIDDLNDKYDQLSKEQQAQAQLLAEYSSLLNALNSKLSVTKWEQTDGGYLITLSDGKILTVNQAIESAVELNGEVTFTMSDGSVIRIHKIETIGWYVLSEGTWGSGDSELAYYDAASETFTTKYFNAKNSAALGETGNDLKLYGSKLYAVLSGMNASSGGAVKVIHPKTGVLITTIPVAGDQPRRMATAGGKVYVTLYSGKVAAIDTATLTITDVATLSGTYPEGICAYNNSLYVCNSEQGPGTTISVVDVATFTETATITVPQNPSMIEATTAGDIYFTTADNTWGGGNPSNLHKFNASNPNNITTFDIRATRLATGKNYVYTVDTDWSTMDAVVNRVNLKTGVASAFDVDSEFYLGYAVAADPATGYVYFTDQMGDGVYVFDESGKSKGAYHTTVPNGSSIVFINK
ncbi:MAG: YncE family protein [Bacteroidales bacterium]|jgi:YVTN family beta-propeller protein|nr:YncE family protein [Bacteroidales bacterium]